MADLNQPTDILMPEQKPKLPTGINVLTILTFIGCGIGLLFTFGGFPLMEWSMRMMDKAQQAGNLTDKQMADMEKSKLIIEKMLANKWALILIGIVGIALCFYGAMMMRKLKKEGFYIYVIGEIFPIIASTALVGFATQFNGVMSYILGLTVPVLFIILYANNLKYLKSK